MAGRPHGWRQALRSIRVQMALLIIALALIGGLVVAVMTVAGYREHSRSTALQLTETAGAMSLAMDGRVEESIGVMQSLAKALAAQPRLDAAALVYFDRISRRMVEGVPDRWVFLLDDQGRRMVDTAIPRGAPVPSGVPEIFKDYQQAGAGHGLFVSDLTRSSLTGRPVVGLVLPLRQPGRPTWYLGILIAPAVLKQLLAAQGLPTRSENWWCLR